MAVTRLNHVSITVADVDRSLAFWHDLLGLPLHGRGFSEAGHLEAIVGIGPVRLEWAELDLPGGQMIELFRYLEPPGADVRPAPNDAGATHVCLEVDDIEGLVERLQAAGAPLRSDGPVRIVDGDWVGWRDVYASDPDGVTVELSEPPRRLP
jgi:catechol 2,3-dioxygenase-like lactoylglutathione lyase family enzyme